MVIRHPLQSRILSKEDAIRRASHSGSALRHIDQRFLAEETPGLVPSPAISFLYTATERPELDFNQHGTGLQIQNPEFGVGIPISQRPILVVEIRSELNSDTLATLNFALDGPLQIEFTAPTFRFLCDGLKRLVPMRAISVEGGSKMCA